eukprot:SAG11_NODE_4655_length_1818_cov_1.430814_1_plen_100_part_00
MRPVHRVVVGCLVSGGSGGTLPASTPTLAFLRAERVGGQCHADRQCGGAVGTVEAAGEPPLRPIYVCSLFFPFLISPFVFCNLLFLCMSRLSACTLRLD